MNSTFNIVSFGSSYERLFPRPVAYSQETVDQATAYVASMEANMGGTELGGALRAAASLPAYEVGMIGPCLTISSFLCVFALGRC